MYVDIVHNLSFAFDPIYNYLSTNMVNNIHQMIVINQYKSFRHYLKSPKKQKS